MSLISKYRTRVARLLTGVVPAVVAMSCLASSAAAQVPESRVREIEQQVQDLQNKLDAVLDELADRGEAPATEPESGGLLELGRLSVGGYGEAHANFTQGSDEDFLDNHRFIVYLGYEFADWIQFHSETELEHSFVKDGDGEISLEQFYFDLQVTDHHAVRIGRYLVPVGIINETHEPTTFYSVERPSVDTFLIPTTWSADGIGVHGRPSDDFEYQLYLGSGLNGSRFDAVKGIRDGRMKERPGINEPGVTGRVDYYPMAGNPDHDLRLGASFFVSGLDNGNKGTSGAPGSLQLGSAEVQYRHGDFEVRGVYVYEHISHADDLNNALALNVAERMQGWYVELAYHFLPDSWKQGKLEKADAVAFVRYEDYDTQDKLPAGFTADPAGDREEVAAGLAFFATDQFVLKADYVYRDDQADLWNLGVGFRF